MDKELKHLHDEEVYSIGKDLPQNFETYKKRYQESIRNPDAFWSEVAKNTLTWFQPFQKTYEGDFSKAQNKWFVGGKVNLCYNALDRHLEKNANKLALIWEGDNPEENKNYTYQELYTLTNRIAWILQNEGLKKGDTVTLYMPMIPELVASVLACARLGLVHSVIFGGFSPHSIRDRILDAESKIVITADYGYRSGKVVPLKQNVDEAIKDCPSVKKLLVFERQECSKFASQKTSPHQKVVNEKDLYFGDYEVPANTFVKPVELDSEDPLFILYTSGSTGKPKGVLHTNAGYGVYAAFTCKEVFNLQANDVYFCTADVGWITGHSYLVYGPLINGATCVSFEGVPTYPDAKRFWQMIDRHKISIFYTSPTALRSLMRLGEEHPQSASLKSLRILGSVGEPINPEAWRWYFEHVGHKQCPIVDTWWQTETGAALITPLPLSTPLKPGSATLPFYGIQPVLLDEKGNELQGEESGLLAIKGPWPSMMRGVYKNPERFFETYFKAFPGYYFTGDACRRDKDGYYWITGRVDDVLNVSGHRLSTAEIESALVLHPSVAEAAVVGAPHDIKGQCVYAYVTLKEKITASEQILTELKSLVAKEISPIAKPDIIQWAPGLPKTRSGKIMRRILRKIAALEIDTLGDTSTLADPSVVEELIKKRKEIKL